MDAVLFQPEWGIYDMAVGEEIVSVFSGSADKEKFNVLPGKSELTAIDVKYDRKMQKLFSLYQKIRDMRSHGSSKIEIPAIYENLKTYYPEEWLLRMEILEQINDTSEYGSIKQSILKDLAKIINASSEQKSLIESGMELLSGVSKNQ